MTQGFATQNLTVTSSPYDVTVRLLHFAYIYLSLVRVFDKYKVLHPLENTAYRGEISGFRPANLLICFKTFI